MKTFLLRIFLSAPFCLSCAVQAAPEIHHWLTDNGARVYFVEASEIPILDVRFVFDAGSSRDGAKPGLAQLVNGLLGEGAGELNANAFNERVADTGAMFSTGARRDMAWVSLRTLVEKKYSTPALALMESVLSRPRFDAEAVQRRKANTLIGIQREQQSPSAIASKTFYKAIYDMHPYGASMLGTKESVKEFTREDIKNFYKHYYVAKNASIAIVGSVTLERATEIASSLSKGINDGESAPPLPAVGMLSEASIKYVEFPSIQSHIKFGQPGIKRGDPDYFPLLIGNHILGGGGLVSILFDEIREKRGLSYSVNSYFTPMAEIGPFAASLQTDYSQVNEAIAVLREEINNFVVNGPTSKALGAAKKNLIGGFPLRIASNSKVLEYLSMIGFYRLPLDYLTTFPHQVAAVSVDDVRSAFQRHLNPEKMVLVVVGRVD
ncbi:MAG TPA: peptidase M16 [Gammaproteobacteria bacterium]|nr:peptidase M16 [Gammaproteobacteria bacterium]|tara:strand:+ start:977 stop:2284 length:1308 start_codon:yes stop_codon:yes gene_type:complete